MTRYPQTLSLATLVVLAASCSLPILKSESVPGPDPAMVAPPRPASTVQIDFHRVPTAAVCPPGDCRKPTLKTLAVDHRATDSTLKPANFAVTRLLNEPNSTVATAPAIPPQVRAPDPASEQQLSVYFRYAEATLNRDGRARIDDALRDMNRLKRIDIRGRTDGLGASPANQRLALSRANAVREHLLAKNPSLAHLVEVEARGSCCYVAPNTTPSGRALNRRVEITLVRQDPDA